MGAAYSNLGRTKVLYAMSQQTDQYMKDHSSSTAVAYVFDIYERVVKRHYNSLTQGFLSLCFKRRYSFVKCML